MNLAHLKQPSVTVRALAGVLAATAGLLVPVQAQRPDFSGRWTLDKTATRLQIGDPTTLDRATLEIAQTETTWRLTRVFSMGGQDNTFSVELPLDGAEVVTKTDAQTRYSHLSWVDGALEYFTRVVESSGESTNVVRYRVSADGTRLDAAERRRGVDNYDNLWVFARQP